MNGVIAAGEIYLPRAYELVRVDHAESVVEHARGLARAGAEEGTLVWAAGSDRQDCESRMRDLHCALVLRPEDPLQVSAQLGLVAAVSLGHAIAERVSPLTELHYGWPSDVLLNHGKAARLTLSAAPTDPEWVVLGTDVNLQSAQDIQGPEVASVCQEGAVALSSARLLEDFSKHLLSWIDRWANDGFAPVRRAWLARAWGLHKPFEFQGRRGPIHGTFMDLDNGGGLILETTKGKHTIDLVNGFGLEA